MRRALETCSALQLPSGFHLERVQWLCDGLAAEATSSSARPRHLVYWMQTSVRAKYNYSLEYAIAAANALALPLHVVYLLSDRSVVPASYAPRDPNAFGCATARHAAFALQGLACVRHKLEKRGLSFEVLHHRHRLDADTLAVPFWTEKDNIDPKTKHRTKANDDDTTNDDACPTRAELLDRYARDAAVVITDRPYLRPWRDALAQCAATARANGRAYALAQVESDVVVPCEIASFKEEYAARTIRPKITAQLKKFLVELDHVEVGPASRTAGQPLVIPGGDPLLEPLDVTQPIERVLELLDLDRSVGPVIGFVGGEDRAVEAAKSCFETKLTKYATERNEPSGDGGSNLSLHLRWGHVSPVRVALNAHKVKNAKEGRESFLEELIVRRELSVNMCVFNAHYDTMQCLPDYAQTTLQVHARDPREHLYNVEQLETGKTFDVYWNAAQLEMVHTGKMHGYMRMYWAKKILEWTSSPELGFRIALYLNNKYALDAPDPNSYTGIAWSFGKHDQGWKERPIFGKVRFMNEAGLKRKFRMDAYVAKVKKLQRLAAASTSEDSADSPIVVARASATKKNVNNTEDALSSGGTMTKKRKTLDAYFAKK